MKSKKPPQLGVAVLLRKSSAVVFRDIACDKQDR